MQKLILKINGKEIEVPATEKDFSTERPIIVVYVSPHGKKITKQLILTRKKIPILI